MDRLPEKDTIEFYIHALPRMHGNRTAMLWKGSYRTRSFTYDEIHDYACRVVTLFRSMGIQKGDRVCIWSYNSPCWPVFFFGCLLSGVVAVPVDFNSRGEFADTIIAKVGAKAILLSRHKDVESPIRKLHTEDLLDQLDDLAATPESELPRIEKDDTVEIIYTSGTTSSPKGVVISNWNLISNIRSLRYMMPLDESQRFLSILPLSHLFEQVLGLFYPVRFGASILYTSTRKSSAIRRLLRKHRITTMVCVPFFVDALRNTVQRAARDRRREPTVTRLLSVAAGLPFWCRRVVTYPVRRAIGSDLRSFICGGSKLPDATEDFWMAMGVRIIQGYGLTEASPVVSCNTIREYKAHTVGKAIPGEDLRIKDDGEILIKGPNVTSGYYEDPEATDAAFEDGWYKTGDIGEMDEDGFLAIKGRKKDTILASSGLNVFPEDIEGALNGLPSVKESCVVGLERDDKTLIYAAVVPEASCADTIEGIVERANEKLNPSQRIQEAGFWHDQTFPKTPTLKIKKHEVHRVLAARMASGAVREKEPAAGVVDASNLRELLGGLLKVPADGITDDSRLVEDLVLDSLGLVELVVMLEERFNADFDESNLGPGATVADLQRLIDSATKSAVRIPDVSWARSPLAMLARDVLQALLGLYLAVVARTAVRGRERLSGVRFPAIFVANHASHLDSPTLLRSLPQAVRRRTAVAAAADYFFGVEAAEDEREGLGQKILPVLAPLVLNAFPLSRRRSIRRSLELLGGILDDGWSVVLYPEGTRSPTGEIAGFKPGIGLIASEMRVPVVPVRLKGLHDILPKGSTIPRAGRAEVVFGTPLSFEGERDYASIAARIERGLRAL